MPAGNLAIGSRSSQVWNASGEATEQTKLPQEFHATPIPASPLTTGMQIPTDHTSFVPGQPNAVVRRWPRMVGMRYLYAHGMTRMPIQHLGADGTPVPWDSAFQPNLHGPIHDAGFNDALFQAGYPGFNLGLSFKVPTVDRIAGRQAPNRHRLTAVHPASKQVGKIRRPGEPPERNVVSAE